MERTPLRKYIEDTKGTRLVWLAGRMGISPTHLHFLLDGERKLLPAHRERLVEIYGEEIRDVFPPEEPNA